MKIYVAVNVKTKKILSINVTDEHIQDSKALPELINNVIKSDNIISIGKLFDDGAYDNNDIFRFLSDNRFLPWFKVRKNARVRWRKGHILRNLSVASQRNDLQRWIVETVFSCLKRRFGEYVYSIKLKNMIQEMMLKVSLYNKLISV